MSEPYVIPTQAVESRLIGEVGYDNERQVLAVVFKGTGHIYHYADVPLDVAAGFLTAPSVGGYYGKQIKGKYPGAKMTGVCPSCGDVGRLEQTCLDCGTAAYQDTRSEQRGETDGAGVNLPRQGSGEATPGRDDPTELAAVRGRPEAAGEARRPHGRSRQRR
jgi:hypothetical protein